MFNIQASVQPVTVGLMWASGDWLSGDLHWAIYVGGGSGWSGFRLNIVDILQICWLWTAVLVFPIFDERFMMSDGLGQDDTTLLCLITLEIGHVSKLRLPK